jgi:excisionase family DNA binding protein
MNQLKTRSELAEVLRVSPKTISRQTQAGRIPVVKIGPGSIRYDLEEVSKALGIHKPQFPQ